MTRKEAIENRRKMWNWIADETERQKRIVTKAEYFHSIGLEPFEGPINHCYCCGYTISKHVACSRGCPIKWGENPDGEPVKCIFPGSSYFSWYSSLSWKEAAKYAREIANLPEREDVQDEG